MPCRPRDGGRDLGGRNRNGSGRPDGGRSLRRLQDARPGGVFRGLQDTGLPVETYSPSGRKPCALPEQTPIKVLLNGPGEMRARAKADGGLLEAGSAPQMHPPGTFTGAAMSRSRKHRSLRRQRTRLPPPPDNIYSLSRQLPGALLSFLSPPPSDHGHAALIQVRQRHPAVIVIHGIPEERRVRLLQEQVVRGRAVPEDIGGVRHLRDDRDR